VTCAACGAENREGARFCDACGAALDAAPARGQRKVVTVLFCDVTGSTALGERLDPEALRAVMSRYFGTARAAIERHGGTVEKFIGDAVMAVFGVPTVREDDALRAVRAAQELRDAVEVDVRIGVNTGEVVTGSGDSLVTGDAVNVAARLEQSASPGEVLVGARTYELVRDAVDVELLPPLEAKGKSEPLTAYRLVGVTGETGVARRADARLVGRERERRLLGDAWARAVTERAPALFTILGSAGVGKSRLAAEFVDDLDATVVRGRCLSYGEGITYWPVVEVVKQLLGAAPPPDAASAALLGDGAASADDIAFSVRKLLEARAAERPLVVLFDDIQWGEPTFLDLIEHVADWSRDAPILLLCLARPDLLDVRAGWGGGKLNATTVLLEPLSAAETDELIDGLLDGESLDTRFRERIRAAAEGNPLFVEQMLAMVEDSGGEVTVPSTIQALLASRLDQLPPAERAALERGAVEGQVFHRGAVAALAPDDPNVTAHLFGLVRKELVRPSTATLPGDDAFRFRHLLIRDAAYDALPKATRADLHERFASWVEERAPDLVELDEIVGYHLEQAAVYRRELGADDAGLRQRAADRLGAAGLRARAREDDHAAASLLGRAAALLAPDDPRRLELLVPLGEALHGLGRLDEAYRTLDEAIEHGDDGVSARAFFYKEFAAGHGESISAREIERRVRARLERLGDDASVDVLALGHTTLAQALFWDGRIAETVREAERALRLARRAGDIPLQKHAAGLAIDARGHGEEPWTEIERDLVVSPPVPGLDLRGTHVAASALLGRVEEARRIYDELVTDLKARGQIVRALGVAMGMGWFAFLDGDDEYAVSALRESWEQLGLLGERGFRSTVGAILADLLARRGEVDEAVAVVDEALAISTPDDWVTVGQAELARAWIALRRGAVDDAIEHARRGTESSDAHEYTSVRLDAWMEYGEVLLGAGRDEQAEAAFAHARAIAERKQSLLHLRRIDALLSART
jgi:class 3 adenylate cyclase/tetratricopeptide (TPR) repeat protein